MVPVPRGQPSATDMSLPHLTSGRSARRLRGPAHVRFRALTGALVLAFGVFGLVNATTLGGKLWQGVVCHV